MFRLFDFLILILVAPIIVPLFLCVLFLAILIHRKSIFFVQYRHGVDKRVFKLYKFRTMIVGAQNIGTGLHSYPGDFRVTSLGKFLRITSLDELPQIFNIIKGDMTFVGPRPAVLGELEFETDLPADIDLRFSVRPGLTGWAQIHGRDNLSWNEKAVFDIEFVKFKGIRRFLVFTYILFYTPFYLLNFSVTHEKKRN